VSGTLALIAALDRGRAIGRGNALPWHLPEDLRRFKRLTLGHPVLMGRKTAESIGRALPGRDNLVLTRSGLAPFDGQIAVPDITHARELAGDGTLFVIGGAEVYALTLPDATQLHLTWVDTNVTNADAWFPPVDVTAWQVVSEQAHAADARHAHAFRFVDYQRRT
jgi:dihydrofolate reductase